MKPIHSKLGSRVEGVALLCLNWDFVDKKLKHDTRLVPWTQNARWTANNRQVTCPLCQRAMK